MSELALLLHGHTVDYRGPWLPTWEGAAGVPPVYAMPSSDTLLLVMSSSLHTNTPSFQALTMASLVV